MPFCPNCGYRPVCSNCGQEHAEAKFCAVCGAALSEALAPGADSASPQPTRDCEVAPIDLEIGVEEQTLLVNRPGFRRGSGYWEATAGRAAARS